VVCEFDQTVKPGVVYAPEKTQTIKVLDPALYDVLHVSVATYDLGGGDGYSEPVRGTAPAVKLVERPDETPAAPGSARNETGDIKTLKVNAQNTADFQVADAQVKGRVGDTVPLQVKFTNAGPGWVLRDAGTPATRVVIKMPAGVSVTKTDGYCHKTGTGTYECGTGNSWVYEGDGGTYDFRVKIGKSASGSKGSLALAGPSRPFDPVKKNDTAAILVDVAGGSTGGGGSTSTGGGSGSGSGSASGSTGSESTGGSSTTGAPGSSTTGGDLASTGSGAALPLTAAAVAAVAVGAGAVVVVRRRSTRQR
jgi:hypothetical protein